MNHAKTMKLSLYEQLYSHVADAINSGRLKPGDRVPSEKELAEQFSVSRITSKKALERLYQDGLIDRIRGKGSFVADDVIPQETGRASIKSNGQESSKLIGVIVPDYSDAYGLKLVQAIEEQSAKSDYHIVIKRSYGMQDREEEAIRSLVHLGVSGLIIFPVHGDYYNQELLRLVLSHFPVVLVDRYLKGIPASTVYTDNSSASRRLTKYLLDKGHQHIAFISPPAENTSTIEERIQGFQQGLREHGENSNPDYILSTLYSTLPTALGSERIAKDKATLQAFLERFPKITGIVACEYYLAVITQQVLQALERQCEVVCFDSPASPLSPSQFTHIQQDETKMGTLAVDLLLEQYDGRTQPVNQIIDFQFVETQS
jgi:GntR family transcriptional regulator, arabinose operon transcriptional repressor